MAEAISVQRAGQSARATLGAVEFERLMAEGSALRDEDIAALAFGRDDA